MRLRAHQIQRALPREGTTDAPAKTRTISAHHAKASTPLRALASVGQLEGAAIAVRHRRLRFEPDGDAGRAHAPARILQRARCRVARLRQRGRRFLASGSQACLARCPRLPRCPPQPRSSCGRAAAPLVTKRARTSLIICGSCLRAKESSWAATEGRGLGSALGAAPIATGGWRDSPQRFAGSRRGSRPRCALASRCSPTGSVVAIDRDRVAQSRRRAEPTAIGLSMPCQN